MIEEAVLFGSASRLVGVIADPPSGTTAQAPGVLLLNSGLTHRVGPNRLYVTLARELAAMGFVTFRFDYSGIGDSEVRRDGVPPEQSLLEETREAMALLATTRGVERFVLLGICSGATTAYLTARSDPRVVGAVMINAQGHLHGTDVEVFQDIRARAVARHSWRMALFSSFRGKNWRKAILGKLNPRWVLTLMIGLPLRRLFQRSKPPAKEPYDALADIRALSARGVRLFHFYSEGDEGLDYFHVVTGGRFDEVAAQPFSRVDVVEGANHALTLLWSQERLVQSVRDWARELLPATPAGGAGTAE